MVSQEWALQSDALSSRKITFYSISLIDLFKRKIAKFLIHHDNQLFQKSFHSEHKYAKFYWRKSNVFRDIFCERMYHASKLSKVDIKHSFEVY